MINFMVLGGPRSATTWAANWLTTDTTICLHDPLLEYPIARLQNLTFPRGQSLGVACTSLCLYPDWVNEQHCPKVVLHRPIEEINRSLRELGLVELIAAKHEARLAAITGPGVLHCPYEHMFAPTGALVIAKHLRVPFDAARWHNLMQMRVEPMWRHLSVGREAVAQLIQRIKESR
jgi:hypothetical protein